MVKLTELITEDINDIDLESIKDKMREYFRTVNFKVNEDGMIHVQGDCRLRSAVYFKTLPITFDRVDGSFDCSEAELTSLQGTPRIVGRNFQVQYNKLTTLDGCPTSIGGTIGIWANKLKSLDALPDSFRGDILLDFNKSLPLLRLLRCRDIRFASLSSVNGAQNLLQILNRHCGDKFSRSSIIQCQKELIDAGFEGNASW